MGRDDTLGDLAPEETTLRRIEHRFAEVIRGGIRKVDLDGGIELHDFDEVIGRVPDSGGWQEKNEKAQSERNGRGESGDCHEGNRKVNRFCQKRQAVPSPCSSHPTGQRRRLGRRR